MTRQQDVVLVPKDRTHLAVTITLIALITGWLGAAVWIGFIFLHKWSS